MENQVKITCSKKTFTTKDTNDVVEYTQYYLTVGNMSVAIKTVYDGDKSALKLLKAMTE